MAWNKIKIEGGHKKPVQATGPFTEKQFHRNFRNRKRAGRLPAAEIDKLREQAALLEREIVSKD